MNDFLHELGDLGITARIKRLNDTLNSNIKELYRSNGLDIEPSWHLVLLLIEKEGKVRLVDLAVQLKISQPAITKVVKKMIDKGYVQQVVDSEDQRVKFIGLTTKGKEEFPKWKRVWKAGELSIKEILQENSSFYNAMNELEETIEKDSFYNRAMRNLPE